MENLVTEKPANGFDIKVEFWNGRHWKAAWAKVPESPMLPDDLLPLIPIRNNGDFGAVIRYIPLRLCR